MTTILTWLVRLVVAIARVILRRLESESPVDDEIRLCCSADGCEGFELLTDEPGMPTFWCPRYPTLAALEAADELDCRIVQDFIETEMS